MGIGALPDRKMVAEKTMEKRIVKANTISAIDVLLGLIMNIEKVKTIAQIEEWLFFNLGTDLFNAWLCYEDDKVTGMLIAEVAFNEYAFISYEWGENLHEQLTTWSNKLGLKKLLKYEKEPDSYLEKGWSILHTVIVKEI